MNAVDNEMTDDGNTCENEDRSAVNGESYASQFRLGNDRVLRRQRRTRIRCHNGLKVPFLRRAEQQLQGLFLMLWLMLISTTRRFIVSNAN